MDPRTRRLWARIRDLERRADQLAARSVALARHSNEACAYADTRRQQLQALEHFENDEPHEPGDAALQPTS